MPKRSEESGNSVPRHDDRLNEQKGFKRRETSGKPNLPAYLLTALPSRRFHRNLGTNIGVGVDGWESSALGGLSDPPTSALQPYDSMNSNFILVLVLVRPVSVLVSPT